MVTIQSIYEQRTKQQNPGLPDSTEGLPITEPDADNFQNWNPDMSKIYEIMSRRFDDGPVDGAERHNEHQP